MLHSSLGWPVLFRFTGTFSTEIILKDQILFQQIKKKPLVCIFFFGKRAILLQCLSVYSFVPHVLCH